MFISILVRYGDDDDDDDDWGYGRRYYRGFGRRYNRGYGRQRSYGRRSFGGGFFGRFFNNDNDDWD